MRTIVKRCRLYATDDFPQLYSYQVDMYTESDDNFLANNDNSIDLAIQYINSIITDASATYEKEGWHAS